MLPRRVRVNLTWLSRMQLWQIPPCEPHQTTLRVRHRHTLHNLFLPHLTLYLLPTLTKMLRPV